jgi:hypothetical protein
MVRAQHMFVDSLELDRQGVQPAELDIAGPDPDSRTDHVGGDLDAQSMRSTAGGTQSRVRTAAFDEYPRRTR